MGSETNEVGMKNSATNTLAMHTERRRGYVRSALYVDPLLNQHLYELLAPYKAGWWRKPETTSSVERLDCSLLFLDSGR